MTFTCTDIIHVHLSKKINLLCNDFLALIARTTKHLNIFGVIGSAMRMFDDVIILQSMPDATVSAFSGINFYFNLFWNTSAISNFTPEF